jgi:four helix bundle protein
MDKFEFARQMQGRTKKFAIDIVRLTRKLPRNAEAFIIRKQIMRSATSTAANYRAACRSRTRREFIAKLGVVIEETDETLFWLEIVSELSLLDKNTVEPLQKESGEILAILLTSRQTARDNSASNNK